MTESEWRECGDTAPMLEFLRNSGKASARKLRLFACCCARRVWHLLLKTESREFVEAAERFADGEIGSEELAGVWASNKFPRCVWPLEEAVAAQQSLSDKLMAATTHEARVVAREEYSLREWAGMARAYAESASFMVAWEEGYSRTHDLGLGLWGVVRNTVSFVIDAKQKDAQSEQAARMRQVIQAGASLDLVRKTKEQCFSARGAEQEEQARVLRGMFGPLPFRSITLDPSLLTWNDGVAVKLAQVAYDERELPSGQLDPVRLAILADAAEEAGCSNQQLLEALREKAPRYRGFWPVDVLLGKE